MEHYDLLIIGGGAAGMAAALAAERCDPNCRILLAERESQLGGVLRQCDHEGFGLGYFHESLTGQEYAMRFRSRFPVSNITVCCDTTVLSLEDDQTALLSSREGVRRISFQNCLLATGCREQTIYSLPVHGTRPAGVFTAGTAQKLVNLGGLDIGRHILILGSGDIGQIMARRFRQLGREVIALVEQNDQLGGMARNRRDCIEAYQIPVILRTTVDEICGEGRIQGVYIQHLDNNRREFIACDTLVTALGLIPERELLQGRPYPPWLKLCGNCDYVHEIVDTVTEQAEKTAEEISLSKRFIL